MLFFVMRNNTIYAQSTIKISKVTPRVTLAGKDSGNLSISTLKGIKRLEVNAPYKIAQFVIVINDNKPGAKPLTFYTLTSKKFTQEVIKDFESRGVNFTFILDEIKVITENGDIRKIPPAVFHVIAD